jgi:hypothetical protein
MMLETGGALKHHHPDLATNIRQGQECLHIGKQSRLIHKRVN